MAREPASDYDFRVGFAHELALNGWDWLNEKLGDDYRDSNASVDEIRDVVLQIDFPDSIYIEQSNQSLSEIVTPILDGSSQHCYGITDTEELRAAQAINRLEEEGREQVTPGKVRIHQNGDEGDYEVTGSVSVGKATTVDTNEVSRHVNPLQPVEYSFTASGVGQDSIDRIKGDEPRYTDKERRSDLSYEDLKRICRSEVELDDQTEVDFDLNGSYWTTESSIQDILSVFDELEDEVVEVASQEYNGGSNELFSAKTARDEKGDKYLFAKFSLEVNYADDFWDSDGKNFIEELAPKSQDVDSYTRRITDFRTRIDFGDSDWEQALTKAEYPR